MEDKEQTNMEIESNVESIEIDRQGEAGRL